MSRGENRVATNEHEVLSGGGAGKRNVLEWESVDGSTD